MLSCFYTVVSICVLILLIIRFPDYGREIWHCITRYTTFRVCDIEFHTKARATLTSIVMRVNIRLGRAVYKGFEAISVFSVFGFLWFLLNMFLWTLECVIFLLS